jgi:GT2 family glycosyltransferase/SAM-dependent methyltransferase
VAEVHLVIVWEHASDKLTEILADIGEHFVLKSVFRIRWAAEHFAQNLTRFYGESLPPNSDKETHIGNGDFHAIIFIDVNPAHEIRDTTKGKLTVNTRVFDSKQRYREWTGGGHKVHGTNTNTEAVHDIWLLLGQDSEGFEKRPNWDGAVETEQRDLVGAHGWESTEELFSTLNRLCNYIVLRNFEPLPDKYHLDDHGDIDLLVDNLDNCIHVTGGRKVFAGAHRVHYHVKIDGQDIPFDFRYIGDRYYDERFQRALLERRELVRDCFFAPQQKDYFHSLLYHALIHKLEFSADYSNRLIAIANSQGLDFDGHQATAKRILDRHLYSSGYRYVRPIDSTVYFNQRWTGLADFTHPGTATVLDDLHDTSDRSSLSVEFSKQGRNSANILRPFEQHIRGDVLELGAGCGAITRYLGECGANVWAVEANPLYAESIRLRTRDLANVSVISGFFDQTQFNRKFDVITLIGVLGHAHLFSCADDPTHELLTRIQSLLKPDGKLIGALDNQFGLKYFAGAPDELFSEPMYGVEGRFRSDLPASYGRQALTQLLFDAGYNSSELLIPLPTYKSPVSIVTEQGVHHRGFDASAFAWQSVRRDTELPTHLEFSLELAWAEIFDNGLAFDLANSFLFVASSSERAALENGVLAYHYSTERRPEYCKETRFVDSGNGVVTAKYQRIAATENLQHVSAGQAFSLHLADSAPYFQGELLSRQFLQLLSHPLWNAQDVCAFTKKYLNAISTLIDSQKGRSFEFSPADEIPGNFFDLLPQNIIETPDHQFKPFDCEWIHASPIRVEWLLFRALFVSLGGIGSCAVPNDLRWLEWKFFIQQTATHCGLSISDEDYLSFLNNEIEFRHAVTGLPADTSSVLAKYRLHVTLQGLSRDELLAQRNRSVAERDVARAERDSALAHIQIITNSRSWELTKLLRFATRMSRQGLPDMSVQSIIQAFRRRYHRLPLPEPAKRVLRFAYHRVLRRTVRFLRRSLTPIKRFRSPALETAAQKPDKADYIVWGVIDWHFRHQRPQQLAVAIAKTGRRVFFVSPVLIDDSRAGFEVEALNESKNLFQLKLFANGAPSVYSDTPSAQTIDQLKQSVGEMMDWANCEQIISLANHPFWTDVASAVPNSRLIYDCMDHHEGFGGSTDSLLQLERKLLREADLTIVTSQWLEQATASATTNQALIRNAVDYAHFANAPAKVYRDPQGRPVIGYYGAIAEWMDFDLVEAVARQHPHCSVLMIGADTVDGTSRLKDLPNVAFTGEIPYGQLPSYLHGFDVCLLPFKLVPLTLATNPVKIYEYLSAGKPTVVVDLPEMAQFEDLVYTAKDQAAFLAAISAVLTQAEPADLMARRKEYAIDQTWKHRAAELISQAELVDRGPQVSVVVVTYNNLDFTRDCLASLEIESQYQNKEIIVVDNASADGSPAFLSDWVHAGSNRKLILNEDNRGFAAANNQGLAVANGEYLVMLNNDTYVTRGWIRTLVGHLQGDQSIGLIGPVTNNIGNEAKIEISYSDMTEMQKRSAAYIRKHLGQIYPLRTAAFFCVMMSRTTYEKIGPLDEAFGRGFFEDDDYCRRIEQIGLRVVCAEDVFIHHHLSASFKKLKQEDRQQLFNENKKLYEQKWGEWIPHGYRPAQSQSRESRPDVFRGQMHFTGNCLICGKETRFYYQDVALWRESLNCEHCRSTSRYRSIASGVLEEINRAARLSASSLAALPRTCDKQLSVYDTQPSFHFDTCGYPLPDLLKATGWIDVKLSQFKPDRPLGDVLRKGITNQNLECLTYADASLDIVITSDVMEHVRLDDRAHREIFRVLKPGGLYLFTVPHVRTWEQTLTRVQINDPDDPAKDVHLLEPEYHGDTNSDDGAGVLAYRTYGKDLERFLADLGFDVGYKRVNSETLGILNTELFCCRKLTK